MADPPAVTPMVRAPRPARGTHHPPPDEVLHAFGATGDPEPLGPESLGTVWRYGGIVLKPVDLPDETRWRAEVLSTLPGSPDFQVARPVRAADGDWTAHGWEAWRHVPGQPDPYRLGDVLRTGKAFHEVLTGLARPAFLDERDNPWSHADRIAWEEEAVDGSSPWRSLLESLAAARQPIAEDAQPVHGDLLGNVLFHDDGPPTVIDWPVYFRPPGWALAVAVVDAITWYRADVALAGRVNRQLLLRALMFRIATNLRSPLANERPEDYRRCIDALDAGAGPA